MNSHDKAQHAKVSNTTYIERIKAKAKKNEKYSKELRIATPSVSPPRNPKPRNCLRWRPTGRIFPIDDLPDISVALVESKIPACEKAITSNLLEAKLIWFSNPTSLLGRLSRFFYGLRDLQWGNILITRLYYVEGLGYKLFSVGQFCQADLEVAFRSNTCFVRNLEGVDLLTGSRGTNLYTINLHEMTSSSPICLIKRATSTNSWSWHRRPANEQEQQEDETQHDTDAVWDDNVFVSPFGTRQ
ncbi:hypothetical protein Tco_0366664 [Tanacetum coccineum]